MIRPASLQDLERLLAIEQQSFTTDLLSRRSFRYMLTKANAQMLIEEQEGSIRGYALVLFNRNTNLARLYSLATDPVYRGQGVASALLAAAEESARQRGCAAMRLETRRDSIIAQQLYLKQGYRQFAWVEDYYEDHAEALRYEKTL